MTALWSPDGSTLDAARSWLLDDEPVEEHPLSCAIWQFDDADVLCDCDEDAS
ncbi:hypothetical protein EV383_4485 [Pseudonocardia sediminis]|uniref:Uncharacterized protein n=1 Tax=Pseudonocardia sediminis TaxID=1397368 RepID=A0A4V6MEC9_PSEST|nr:hypothetical protein [Pseudonocardia sediminis]RZT87560.1 hypothetical protein EV383_4485 [Pseudonocardia sediminis]